MYIEFHLPTGHEIAFAVDCIEMDIQNWSKQHQIFYKTKRHKNTYRLILRDTQAYSHFALTWDPMWAASKKFSFRQPK